jgi:SAM-dependent methyltransferase
MTTTTKNHWENVYETKQPNEVSWTQDVPQTSLKFIEEAQLDKSANIIDIGGGDSKLIDFLLAKGYQNITVLDISANALERAKKRLGGKAKNVTWVVSDINEFNPETKYDFWHDRATFHFLTEPQNVKKYGDLVKKSVAGFLTIGTFSENGPKKCSGLDIKQYSHEALVNEFKDGFRKIKCISENHETPFSTIQNFTFCTFKANNQ